LCSSPNVIQVATSRWVEHVACVGGCAYKALVGKPQGRKPGGRLRHRWGDNFKIHVQEIGCGVEWIDLAEDKDKLRALLNTVMNFQAS